MTTMFSTSGADLFDIRNRKTIRFQAGLANEQMVERTPIGRAAKG